MLKIYLIRHGETDWNSEGRIQGLSDVELNGRGEEQANRLAARLAHEAPFQALYASPLKRASRTAECIGSAVHLAIRPDGRLLERSLGELEGLTLDEIRQQFPEVHHAWTHGGMLPRIPGEETRDAFFERTSTFVRDLKAEHSEGRVLVVTHGGTVNMLLMTILNLDSKHNLPFTIDNASISLVTWGERGPRLKGLNDVCHLASVPVLPVVPSHAASRINAAEVK